MPRSQLTRTQSHLKPINQWVLTPEETPFSKKNGATNGTTLENVLRPLWKLTYYSGVSLDWCRPNPSKCGFINVIRWIGVFISFCLLLSMALFQLSNLLIALRMASNTHSVVYNVLWFTSLPISLFTHLKFFFNRNEFLRFFQDWKELELELSKAYYHGIVTRGIPKSKLQLLMYFSYAGLSLVSIMSVTFDMSVRPDISVFITSSRFIRENFPLPVLFVYQVAAMTVIWTMVSLIEIIPAFIYLHFAKIVGRLEQDASEIFSRMQLSNQLKLFPDVVGSPSLAESWKRQTSDPLWNLDVPIRRIWSRLEDLNVFVIRANSLFGSIMIGGQGNSIFLITVSLYSILYNLNRNLKEPGLFINFLLFLMAIAFRYISCSLISSQLYQAVNSFRNFLTDKVGRNWGQMSKEDQKLLCSFIERLQSETIAACPLGLYNLNSSTLLTVFSLIVSYVIVLLQSK